jgi:hypothetical protein
VPKAPPIDRSEWTDRSAYLPDVSKEVLSKGSFALWQPVAAARAYWMAAMVKTIGAEALGKTFMLQSLAPETSMVENDSLERPVIVTAMGDGLFVVHLRRNDAGLYECDQIESLWARQMPAGKAAPVYDVLPDGASPVERLLNTYRATVRRNSKPLWDSIGIEVILKEADAVAVEQLMPKRELLFEEAARRLAQLPQAEPIDRTEWQPVDDAPTREMVDSMGKDLSEAGGIAVAWDPIRMAQQVRMSVLTRSKGPAAIGIQSMIAAAAMGYCDAVADAEAAHPVIVTRLGDEMMVVGLRLTDKGTYALDHFERLARKK